MKKKIFFDFINLIKNYISNNIFNSFTNDIPVLPDNVSPLRYITSMSDKISYKYVKTFDEAKRTDNCIVIMEGDWGGQIYLTCPMKFVKCNEESLKRLLSYIDKLAWDCNEGDGKGIYYEIKNIGDFICGGMNGGIVLDGLWVHDEFKDIKSNIQQIIDGNLSLL